MTAGQPGDRKRDQTPPTENRNAMETPAKLTSYIPALDGIRSVALLLVFLRHLVPEVESMGFLEKLLWRSQWIGWVGVDIFFVLSGFLITRILLRDEGQPNALKKFYAFRAVRIWPNYLLLVGSVVGLASFFPSSPELTWLKERQAWLWLHQANWLVFFDDSLPFNLTILWTLAVEEQFYAIWPLLLYWLSARRLLQLCLTYLCFLPFNSREHCPNILWCISHSSSAVLGNAVSWIGQNHGNGNPVSMDGSNFVLGARLISFAGSGLGALSNL